MRLSIHLTGLSLLAIGVLSGCETDTTTPAKQAQPAPSEDGPSHDHDDVLITAEDVERPADYADAVKRIRGYRTTIQQEIAAGRPGKAHRPLDELNFVLEWLPEIAQDSDVPKESWEAVTTSAQEMRESFDAVHAQIDADEKADYDAVAEKIDAALNRLEQILPDANAEN